MIHRARVKFNKLMRILEMFWGKRVYTLILSDPAYVLYWFRDMSRKTNFPTRFDPELNEQLKNNTNHK
jgi:hypothetical protein